MEKNKYSQKTEIIAEIANAHQGDPNNAEKLAIKSFLAGADAVLCRLSICELDGRQQTARVVFHVCQARWGRPRIQEGRV